MCFCMFLLKRDQTYIVDPSWTKCSQTQSKLAIKRFEATHSSINQMESLTFLIKGNQIEILLGSLVFTDRNKII